MKSAKCYAIAVRTQRLFTPKWTWSPCEAWPYRGWEVVNVKLRRAIHDYLALRRGLGFKLVKHEVALREFAAFLAGKRHHGSHLGVGHATRTPPTTHLGGTIEHRARVRPLLECHGSWDRNSAVKPTPLSSAAGSAVPLFQPGNPAIAASGSIVVLPSPAATLDLPHLLRIVGGHGTTSQ